MEKARPRSARRGLGFSRPRQEQELLAVRNRARSSNQDENAFGSSSSPPHRQPCAGARPYASAWPAPPRDSAADNDDPCKSGDHTGVGLYDPRTRYRTQHISASTEALSAFRSRHRFVLSAEHARHQLFHPLFSFRFGRNAENGSHCLQCVQCRPVGGYRVTHENATPRSVTTIRKFPARRPRRRARSHRRRPGPYQCLPPKGRIGNYATESWALAPRSLLEISGDRTLSLMAPKHPARPPCASQPCGHLPPAPIRVPARSRDGRSRRLCFVPTRELRH